MKVNKQAITSKTAKRRRSLRPCVLGLVLGTLCAPEAVARAQTVDVLDMQKAPAVFKLQAKVSQAKLPVGDGRFTRVIVNVLPDASNHLTIATLSNVLVRDGVINLDISGPALEQHIANNPALLIEVCIEQSDNCLQPIPISSVPYAIKSTYAVTARNAIDAAHSADCDFTHKATSDREPWTADAGVGYIDFETPVTRDTNGNRVLDTARIALGSNNPTSTFDGMIAFRSMSLAGRNLHICGASSASGTRTPLANVLIHSATTKVHGALTSNSLTTNVITAGKVPTADAPNPNPGTTNVYTNTNFGLSTTDTTLVQPSVTFYGNVNFAKGFTGGPAPSPPAVRTPLQIDPATAQIRIGPCLNGQYLTYNGSIWACTTPPATTYTGTAPIVVNASTRAISMNIGYERKTGLVSTSTTSGTITVPCSAGKEVIGGGCLADPPFYVVTSSPVSDTDWKCEWKADSAPPSARALLATAICGDVK